MAVKVAQTYDIDRHKASELLDVSTRTLDRYIRSGKLSSKKIRGRVLLKMSQVRKISEEEFMAPKNLSTTVKVSHTPKREELKTVPRENVRYEKETYKELYDDVASALKDKEMKLEQSLYRIGQLESQVSARFPVTTNADATKAVHVFEQNLEIAEREVRQMRHTLKAEKTNRVIITAILYGVLILQPIFWYLMRSGVAS